MDSSSGSDEATADSRPGLPPGLDPVGLGWQQRKSIQTRIAILEAAITSLERYGYGRTTIELVAQTADLSRGAMRHHYKTKLALIEAVIDYSFHNRLQAWVAGVRSMTEEKRLSTTTHLLWESLQSREHTIYLELRNAARTDEDLARIFLPKSERLAQMERDQLFAAFPEWWDKRELFDVAINFAIATVEGVRIHRHEWDEVKQAQIFTILRIVLRQIRDGGLPAPVLEPDAPGSLA